MKDHRKWLKLILLLVSSGVPYTYNYVHLLHYHYHHCTAMSSSQSLKDEGNQLFSAKNFAEASKKYSDAIAAEGGSTNAVLYANRAACRLNLKQ